jgi:hypothetical protein
VQPIESSLPELQLALAVVLPNQMPQFQAYQIRFVQHRFEWKHFPALSALKHFPPQEPAQHQLQMQSTSNPST